MFGITTSALMVVILSHNSFAQSAQTLHDRRLSEVVNQTSRAQENSQVYVGHEPFSIEVDETTNTVYVVYHDPDVVSVISGENNTKIKDIDVGDSPSVIAVNEFTARAYVANEGSNSVSIIDLGNNTKIKDIDIGQRPGGIAFNKLANTVYVANVAESSISVINGTTNEPVINGTTNQPLTIPVGLGPGDIAVNHFTNTAYVANKGSRSISVIDGQTNELVTGVTFRVNPFNYGYIICDDPAFNKTNGLTTPPPPSPTEQYIYVSSGTHCTAKPYEGFEFLSWEHNLEDNSTQLLSFSTPTSPLNSYLEYVSRNKSSDKPEATLNVNRFGTFIANFREAPAPLPPEFWAQMYAVIATVITALFIPSIVGWIRSKRDVKKLNYYHKKIDSLYADGKLDEKDMKELDDLRGRVMDAYSEGKVNEKHYETLKGEISTLYEEIFRKKIAALDGRNNYSDVRKPIQEQLAQTKNEIKYAFSKGKINEKHYDLLNEDISNLDGKENAPQKQAKTPSHADSV